MERAADRRSRPARRVALRLAGGAALIAGSLASGCAAPPAGLALELPGEVPAVEARFGNAYCRRLEDPASLARLVDFASAHRTGWQAAWNEPPPAQLELRFESGSGPSVTLGVGDGQLRAAFDGRAHFQPLDEAARRDLVELVGGPPLSTPELPCRAGS
jgi:hypothetical protein